MDKGKKVVTDDEAHQHERAKEKRARQNPDGLRRLQPDVEVIPEELQNHLSGDDTNNEEFQEENPESSTIVFVDASEYFYTDKVFTDQDAVFTWCKEVGRSIGMVVVTEKSERQKSGQKPRLILCCERSGEHRPRPKKVEEEEGVGKIISSKLPRKTSTKKCGCPFRLKGVLDNDGGWRITVDSGLHNHSLGDNLFGHSYAGRFTREEEKLVTDLTMTGVKPREMINIVKKRFPGNQSTKATVYNFRAKHKLKRLEGRTEMQQLLKDLDDNDYVEFHREDPITAECMDIFFAHPESIRMAKCFPEVIILDCTYKTVRQKLPLLEIVGFTSTMKTFAIAFVYLTDEKIDNYQGALQTLHEVLENKAFSVNVIMTDCELAAIHAISIVFPNATHLLCRWHVERNIEGNYKKTFDTVEQWEAFIDMFKDMMLSSKVEDYEKKLDMLKQKYGGHADLVAYIEKQWLSKYKEKFVSAWTNSVMHFRTHTTNRAESMHASLKRNLVSGVNTLTHNWKFIDNLLESQLTEITGSFNRSRNIWGVDFKGKPWMQVRGSISKSAMDMLAKELRRSRFFGVDQEQCGCVAKTTSGLPCAHELSHIITFQDSFIPLSSIHERWRKLDNMPVELPREALDIQSELAAIEEKFYSGSEHQKVMMIKKLRALADPKSTYLQEPRVKENVRGRPAKSKGRKVDTSTKREPSLFETSLTLEERQENMKKPKPKAVLMDVKSFPAKLPYKRGKKKPKTAAVITDIEYECKWDEGLSDLNPIIRDFITSWEDVPRDGNCGFRSVAVLLGLKDSDGWALVRGRLFNELNEHYQEYSDFFGLDMMEYLTNNLQCTKSFTMNKDNWFTFPEMGYLVACAYNCVFVHIQPGQRYRSCFPLRTAPNPDASANQILVVAHIENYSHFVPVHLSDGAPIPPCAAGWNENKWPDALLWKDLYQERMDMWETVLPRNFSKLVHQSIL